MEIGIIIFIFLIIMGMIFYIQEHNEERKKQELIKLRETLEPGDLVQYYDNEDVVKVGRVKKVLLDIVVIQRKSIVDADVIVEMDNIYPIRQKL